MTDPQAVAAPRTAAGRGLSLLYRKLDPLAQDELDRRILAIEAEAAASAPPEPLRAALERLLWAVAGQGAWSLDTAVKNARAALASASEATAPPAHALDASSLEVATHAALIEHDKEWGGVAHKCRHSAHIAGLIRARLTARAAAAEGTE